MSEIDTSAVEARAEPGAGAMLRMAREARGTTIAEVAAALKMSPRQIEAIENEDFSRLSGATFIRGFIRNYARLLKIDSETVLAALTDKAVLPQTELSAPVDVGVKMPASGGRQARGLVGATLFALGMLAVALVLYFDIIDLESYLKHKDGPTATTPVIQPQVLQPLATPAPTVATTASAQAGATAEKSAEAPDWPASTPGAQQLTFSFGGSSWVEVKDATGRTIFSQMNPKGSTQVIEGRSPFQLVVGNASQVRLQYNGQPVDLVPHTRVEVARLTLE